MKKIMLIIIVVFIVGFSLYQFCPRKIAVKKEQISNENYILVKSCATTLANWQIIREGMDVADDKCYVRLEGEEPRGFNYDFMCGDNTYVCYGKFLSDGNLKGETYKRFYVEEWDILYPISRNCIFDSIMPKGFICNLDICR